MGVTLLVAAGFSGELAAQTLTTLYSFAGLPDGASPLAGVISDATGNLYGTTEFGGNTICGSGGCGTVFKLTPNGSGGYGETVLYTFTGPDGAFPYTGDLITDAAGNLYGTTNEGGGGVCALNGSCGVVFKLTPNGSGGYSETVLYRFAVASPSDGAIPLAGLIADAMGNLYGTTVQSGGGGACGVPGCGIVFKLTPNGSGAYSETVLYRFTGGTDGAAPRAGLISDAMGNLYGTTAGGGGGGSACGVPGCGIVCMANS
jgi:hypothetical protein